jgi:hypothetical protein
MIPRSIPCKKTLSWPLREAVKEAIAERTREGLPVYVWEYGKVVDLNAPKRRTSLKRTKPPSQARKTRNKSR